MTKKPITGAPVPVSCGDIMRKRVAFATSASSVLDAARLMEEYGCGALPVLDENRQLIGMITDRDIVLRVCTTPVSAAEVLVTRVMSPRPIYCSPQDSLATAEALLVKHRIKRLPVIEAGQLVGIVSLADIAQVEQPLELARIARELGAHAIRLEHP